MGKQTFWNDAAKYGTIMGLISIAFNALDLLMKNGLLSFLSLSVFVVLLYIFTKRRATLYGGGQDGYSYGRCLVFIICMMLFAGVLQGVYGIAASRWLFVEEYEQMTATSYVMLQNTGFYNRDQLDMVVKLQKSPLILIFGAVFGMVIKGCFFGLFIAGFAKREPNIFVGPNE